MIWRRALRFSVAVDGVVAKVCDVVGVRLVDFGAVVLDLDSSFGGCFCLDLGGVFWVKSQMSMSSISSLVLTSKISSTTLVLAEGS